MIKKVLTYCADQLNSYLSRYHHRPEGLAEVGHIGQSTNELTNEARAETKFTLVMPCKEEEDRCQTPNKIIVSLVNLERETAGGIAANVRTSNGGYTTSAAPLLLNLTIEIPKSHKKYDIWGILTTIFAFLGKFTVSLP